MKTKFLYILSIVLWMCSCENYPYYVPDNFPKETFFSYLPYEQGQELFYHNGSDTIKFVVSNVHKNYIRGERNCDCGIENAYSTATLLNNSMELVITCNCVDRSRFDIKLEDNWDYTNHTGNVELLGEYWYEQKKQSEDIFKYFVEEICLINNVAQVKQNIGLVYFIDKDGTQWSLVK